MTCQAQERVRAIIGDPSSADEFTVAKFRTKLEKFLGNDVQIVAMRLPFGCAALWTGLTAADRFAFNLYWPVRAVEMVAHAAGHLLLGHCGKVRDAGQFACVLTDPRSWTESSWRGSPTCCPESRAGRSGCSATRKIRRPRNSPSG
jgi:hypothetical protein